MQFNVSRHGCSISSIMMMGHNSSVLVKAFDDVTFFLKNDY